MRKEIYKQKNNFSSSLYKNDYLNGIQEYACYWYNNLTNWLSSIFAYTYRHVRNDLEWGESLHNFNDPEINIAHFEPMWNILKNIDSSYEPSYNSNFYFKNTDVETLMEKITELAEIFSSPSSTEYENGIKAYNSLKEAYNKNQALDVINFGLLLARRAEEMLSAKILKFDDCKALKNNAALLAKYTFDNVLSRIKGFGPESSIIPGYKGMGNFKSA